jgi:hypothetical protein
VTLGPVRVHVSNHVMMAASDREFAGLTASSGTQRARCLLVHRSVRVVLLVRQRPYPQLRACRVASWRAVSSAVRTVCETAVRGRAARLAAVLRPPRDILASIYYHS